MSETEKTNVVSFMKDFRVINAISVYHDFYFLPIMCLRLQKETRTLDDTQVTTHPRQYCRFNRNTMCLQHITSMLALQITFHKRWQITSVHVIFKFYIEFSLETQNECLFSRTEKGDMDKKRLEECKNRKKARKSERGRENKYTKKMETM